MVLPRFHLDDEAVIDKHVETLRRQLFSFVENGHRHFTRYAMPARAELALQRHFVDVLQKSVTEHVVDVVERADDGACESLMWQSGCCHAPRYAKCTGAPPTIGGDKSHFISGATSAFRRTSRRPPRAGCTWSPRRRCPSTDCRPRWDSSRVAPRT